MKTILFSESLTVGNLVSTRHVARTVRKKNQPVAQTYVSPGSITAQSDLLSGGRVEEATDKDGNWRRPQVVDAREDAKFWAEYDEAVFELQMQSLEEQCEKQKE